MSICSFIFATLLVKPACPPAAFARRHALPRWPTAASAPMCEPLNMDTRGHVRVLDRDADKLAISLNRHTGSLDGKFIDLPIAAKTNQGCGFPQTGIRLRILPR